MEPLGLWFAAKTQAIALGSAALLVVAGGVIAYLVWRSRRVSPEERERRRRAALAAHGKMIDGALVDVQGNVVVYCYTVRGVEYTASQDLGDLELPVEPGAGAVAITVKCNPRNPADSIVQAENWSGLRATKRG